VQEVDIALMARIKKGDIDAFEELVSRHQRPVYNLALRFLSDSCEAEDIAQEAFIRVFRAADNYTPDAKFTTWLFTIVKNLCFNAIRKRQSANLVSMDEETIREIASREDDPARMLEREQIRQRVNRAVNTLPENLRIAVILQKFHGLSYEEIAAVLGCSVNAVKLRVHRAKDFLSRELAGIDETK
jgi:RNA polymerase sigma-70 factor (ECF subfamily)